MRTPITCIVLTLLCFQSTARGAEPKTAMLVPGLRTTRLPVELTNINSVEYGPDGRLYAVGYDGRVHALTDSDGDGVEDTTKVFWDKPGDLLTPVGILPAKDGVYVVARGKIALLKDTDGDSVADVSEVVVSGWKKESINSDTRNDAAGITIDKDGNLYFSLGCMSYNKAWQLDKKGKSQYDPTSERGTILKVSPDRRNREILATGTRFVIGLDFNKHGDLFATDQEGDTWFPGGNPRDELLHVIPGRHYGFPFRHPKYLPSVVDEPEVVGFSPQHQSTCGFRFNETRVNRKPFGPQHWDGNAIVTGFSRGKLWRVPLAKTRAGYVGKQIQFAAFESLLTDVAVSPAGDLLVTGHSGSPDWGAGPTAKGHLYKLQFDRETPQPVAVWPASPVEVKVAFDRPINREHIATPEIEMGEFAWEGDDHEWIFPGYDVVKAAKRAVRRPLKVKATSVSPNGRTVTFTTSPHPWRSRYRVTVPGVTAANANDHKRETIELSYDLSGVRADWKSSDQSTPSWSGWLPHVDTSVIRTMTSGSEEHDRFRTTLNLPGQLVMRSRLHLPGKSVTLRFEGSDEFRVLCRNQNVAAKRSGSRFVCELHVKGKASVSKVAPRGGRDQVLPTEEVALEIQTQTRSTKGEFFFDASYHADFDSHERPLRLEHLIVPWAPKLRPPTAIEHELTSGKRVTGDPEKGREVFFGKEANCAACHSFAGRGGKVAADLTVSIHRDPDAVMRDIIKPNDSINPDYVSYTLQTDDGRALTGLFQSADKEQITLIDTNAKSHSIVRDQVDLIRASSVSLMPSGFDKLGKEKLQNLVAFLCTEDIDAKRKGLPTGVILREYWLDVKGSGVSALTQLSRFPNKPSGSSLLTKFEGPINGMKVDNGQEYYGARIRGYVHPPHTGDYVFWLAADDSAEVWLSATEDAKDKTRILKLNRWTRPRDWDAYSEQKSKPIHLKAGKRYYVEALHHEATVDDCLAVGWQLPDGTRERPIPGSRLSAPREPTAK